MYDIEALKAKTEVFIKGVWTEYASRRHTSKTQKKNILNYWTHQGAVQYQDKLEAIFGDEQPEDAVSVAISLDDKAKITHHSRARDTCFRTTEFVLRCLLGRIPTPLKNDDESKAVVEALV